jgi:plastocyanin
MARMSRPDSGSRKLRLIATALLTSGALALPIGIAEAADAPDSPAPAGSPAPDSPEPTSAVAPAAAEGSTSLNVSRAAASAAKSVSIVDYDFKPKTITVNTGDTVTWTNDGKVAEGHNVTGDGGLDSGNLSTGDTYSHSFGSAGSFAYVCTLHPLMKGTVKVLARSAGGGGKRSGGSGGSCDACEEAQQNAAATAGAAGTESAAVAAADPAGTDSSLPATGSDSISLLTIGELLLALGLGLRIAAAAQAARRRA